MVFPCFFWFPYWFCKENQRKTIRKPIPADSGTSPEIPSGSLSIPSFLFHLYWREENIQSGLLWTCSGPLRSLFLLLSLLWGSFSGTSPESLLVVWPPPGSSGWLWPPPSSLCLLLRVITSGLSRMSKEIHADPCRHGGRREYTQHPLIIRGRFRISDDLKTTISI